MRRRQADEHHVAGDLPLELGRRALGDDLAVVHDGDPVAERVGLVQVVRGDEDGHALAAQPADLVPHVRAALRVEAGGRLVEEDDLRLVDDAERDVDPAALAAGVGLALAVGVLGELERLQRAGGAPLRVGLARCRTCRACSTSSSRAVDSSQVLPPWATYPMRRRTSPGSLRRSAPAMVASPPSGSMQRGEHPQRGGLAGAVGAEEAEDLALGDVEVDAADRLDHLLLATLRGSGTTSAAPWSRSSLLLVVSFTGVDAGH